MELTPQPYRLPGRGQAMTAPVAKIAPLPAEAMYHFWYPGREGVERCPADFATELTAFHPDLTIVRPPMRAPTPTHPWLVWYRKPSVTYWLSPGWVLLFAWQLRDGTPLPLDNRIFANLYRISAMTFGNGVKYFDSIVATLKAEKAAREQADENYRHDRSADYFEYTKIKSSGKGNKFALHHDGTIVPGRGERNWLADRGDRAMPGEVAAEAQQKRAIRRKRR